MGGHKENRMQGALHGFSKRIGGKGTCAGPQDHKMCPLVNIAPTHYPSYAKKTRTDVPSCFAYYVFLPSLQRSVLMITSSSFLHRSVRSC
eukprot:351286-Chlamydomonas_euryale.AAC.2